MTKMMIIIGEDDAINEIAETLKVKTSQEWYHEGNKEFDADVKIIDVDKMEHFHLG